MFFKYVDENTFKKNIITTNLDFVPELLNTRTQKNRFN